MCECNCGTHTPIDTTKPVKLFDGFVETLGEEDSWDKTFTPMAIEFLVENKTFMVTKVGDHTYKNEESGIEFNDFELENVK